MSEIFCLVGYRLEWWQAVSVWGFYELSGYYAVFYVEHDY